MAIENLTEKVVLDFLDDLEANRGTSPTTRNQRLAAIKTFFRFLANEEPTLVAACEKICAIPAKNTTRKIIGCMDQAQIRAIINAPDSNNWGGMRDQALMLFLYNTGARAQEVVDLNIGDLNLEQAPQVLITGKGCEQRVVPLWKEAAQALRTYLDMRKTVVIESEILFLNREKQRMGRFGIGYIVAKYKEKASKNYPSLRIINPESVDFLPDSFPF